MNDSKWNYIAVGAAAMGTLVGALAHSWLALSVNFFFMVFNWYVATAKREAEKEGQDKPNE